MDTHNPETATSGSAGDNACEESGAAHHGNATLRHRYQQVEQQLSHPTIDPRTQRQLERELDRIGQSFIEANVGLAYRFTAQFTAVSPEQRDDYIAAAHVGLWRAWTTWQPERGPFGPWAWRHMKASVLPTVRQDDHPGLSERAFAAKPQVMAAIHELTLQLGETPSGEQVAEHTGVSPRYVADVLTRSGRPSSLDAPAGGGEETGATVGDLLATPGEQEPGETEPEGGALDLLNTQLSTLKPTELWTIIRRHGLDGAPPQYIREIADDLQIGREAIRRHVNAATEHITGTS